MAIFFCWQNCILRSSRKVPDFNRMWSFSAEFLMKVPSAKFYRNPFSENGAYTGARMDGLTEHEVNRIWPWQSERSWKRRVFPWRWCGRDMNLTNRLHVIQRLAWSYTSAPNIPSWHGAWWRRRTTQFSLPYRCPKPVPTSWVQKNYWHTFFFRKSNKCTWTYECNFITQ